MKEKTHKQRMAELDRLLDSTDKYIEKFNQIKDSLEIIKKEVLSTNGRAN